MNEKLFALAKQAGFYEMFTSELTSPYTEETDVSNLLAEFAQLIVRECVNVVEGGSFLHDQAPTAIFAIECSAAIKRHFGVKE
jgi:hypothetical protein